jgi:hypothetical protein
MAAPTTIPTGKKNALASLRSYIQTQLSPTKVVFENYLNAEDVPCIAFEDMGIPGLGGHCFDDYMGEKVSDAGVRTKVHGKVAQTMVEFNLLTNVEENTSAVKDLYTMRDRLEYALMYSGKYNDAGVQIMPRIALLDFDASPSGVDTGASVWAPMEKDSVWMENYIGTDQERPQIKRLRILVRIYWHLLLP